MADTAHPDTQRKNGGKGRQRLIRVLSVLITLILLAVLAGEVKWDEFDDLLGKVAVTSWLAALLAYLALNLFRALRFRILLDKSDSPWRILIPITLYHNFLVRALPFKLGELSYIVLLRSRLNYSMEEGVSSLFGARILELLIIVMVFASGVLTAAEQLAAERVKLMLLIAVTFVVSVSCLYFGGSLIRGLARLLLPPLRGSGMGERGMLARIESRSLQLADELDRVRQPRLFLSALFISCFTYTSSFLTNFILLQALGIDVELSSIIAIISVGMFASAFPLNVSGFGVVELSWRFGLVQFAGWHEADATAAGFLLHFFQLFAAAIWGLAGYLMIQVTKPLPSNAAAIGMLDAREHSPE